MEWLLLQEFELGLSLFVVDVSASFNEIYYVFGLVAAPQQQWQQRPLITDIATEDKERKRERRANKIIWTGGGGGITCKAAANERERRFSTSSSSVPEGG